MFPVKTEKLVAAFESSREESCDDKEESLFSEHIKKMSSSLEEEVENFNKARNSVHEMIDLIVKENEPSIAVDSLTKAKKNIIADYLREKQQRIEAVYSGCKESFNYCMTIIITYKNLGNPRLDFIISNVVRDLFRKKSPSGDVFSGGAMENIKFSSYDKKNLDDYMVCYEKLHKHMMSLHFLGSSYLIYMERAYEILRKNALVAPANIFNLMICYRHTMHQVEKNIFISALEELSNEGILTGLVFFMLVKLTCAIEPCRGSRDEIGRFADNLIYLNNEKLLEKFISVVTSSGRCNPYLLSKVFCLLHEIKYFENESLFIHQKAIMSHKFPLNLLEAMSYLYKKDSTFFNENTIFASMIAYTLDVDHCEFTCSELVKFALKLKDELVESKCEESDAREKTCSLC